MPKTSNFFTSSPTPSVFTEAVLMGVNLQSTLPNYTTFCVPGSQNTQQKQCKRGKACVTQCQGLSCHGGGRCVIVPSVAVQEAEKREDTLLASPYYPTGSLVRWYLPHSGELSQTQLEVCLPGDSRSSQADNGDEPSHSPQAMLVSSPCLSGSFGCPCIASEEKFI